MESKMRICLALAKILQIAFSEDLCEMRRVGWRSAGVGLVVGIRAQCVQPLH